MHEFKKGSLHSGKGGKVVKDRKQAIAIMLSERRREGGKKKRGASAHDAANAIVGRKED